MGMGSAAAWSTAKRFSFRSIAMASLALAVLVFLTLLVVAGGTIAALDHKDAGTSSARAVFENRQSTRPPLPRKKLPTEAVHQVTEEATSRHHGGTHRRRPAGGVGSGEPLPRGVVHDTTNLEMEPSLGGHPRRGRQRKPPPNPKSLLAVPVGIKNKAVVDKLVSKFLAAADFTVMLFHYDGAVEQWGDLEWSDRAVVHVAARWQTKWWFAKRFLHPDVVAEYEYVFVWDEDIEVDAFDPVRYLDVVRREGLEVSQPALDRRSEIHHAITKRPLVPTADGVHRRVRENVTRCVDAGGGGDRRRSSTTTRGPPCEGFVEVMVPVFSRAAWRCAWRMVQNDLVHGWGLDSRLGYCARGDRALSVGVVDSEYVLHRGVPVLRDGRMATPSAGRVAVRARSYMEMWEFDRRWNVAAAEDDSWTDRYAYGSRSASDGEAKSST